jgi:glycosyltransferase involved in cell wall biosynthesis
LSGEISIVRKLREIKHVWESGTKVVRQQGLASLVSQSIEKLRRREFHIIEPSVPYADYLAWIKKNEPTEVELAEQRVMARRLKIRPLISLLTPVWNPRPEVLSDALSSILTQTYDKWELCAVDGGSIDRVRRMLQEFSGIDERIQVTYLNNNQGISASTNVALQQAHGSFVGFMDQDDVLAPFALYEVAAYIDRQPDLDFIYSDMDRLDAEGRRLDPLFKPQWSPEIMLSANYVVHFCVVRSTLLRQMGGLRSEIDGAQDWDMILRASEITSKIYRIPKILYHWRQAPTSIATTGLRFRPAHIDAQLRVISDYVYRKGMKGTIRPDTTGSLRVRFQLDDPPFVSIVIYPDDSPDELLRCIRSVERHTTYDNYEILVVDAKPHAASNTSAVVIQDSAAKKFSSATNAAVRSAKGSVIVFLDVHTEVVTPEWLQELVGWSVQPWVGAVGLKLLSPNGRIRHGGVIIGLPDYVFSGSVERTWTPLGHTEWYRNYSAVSAACMATRENVFKTIGGFDEAVDSASDLLYCLRLGEQNYRIVYTPFAKLLLHDCHCHTSQLPGHAGVDKFEQPIDPYFNPNLTIHRPIPTIRL